MKLGSACLQCRAGKRKCDKAALRTACEQCKKRGLHCSSLEREVSGAILFPSPRSVPSNEINTLPPAEVVEELIDLYICYIHDKPHSLFHEPWLRQAARDGTLHHGVVFGITGLSARLSSNLEIRSQGHAFAGHARTFVQTNLESICLENVQALILVGNVCLAESNPDSESLYFGMMALID
jgi:Fungal Zn(2)-Cys(6) binuclear cluster domain